MDGSPRYRADACGGHRPPALPGPSPQHALSRTMLYGVKPVDGAIFTAAAIVLAAVAVLAGWLPARRAARIDPMVALRYE